MMELAGIPIMSIPGQAHTARARGLLWGKRVTVNADWERLPVEVGCALVAHEIGHLVHDHLWKRILLVPLAFISPSYVSRTARQHELEADAFAAELGYGAELALYLGHANHPESDFYPSCAARVDALLNLMRGDARC